MTVDEIIASLNEERKSAKQQIRIRIKRIREKCQELLALSKELGIERVSGTISGLSQAIEKWLENL